MLLTIHNLPSSSRYVDIKSLLHEKCGLTELILDNLVSEGKTKKVTVGVADEGDAAILVRKINGLYVQGLQLYVEDKRKTKESDQPYRSSTGLIQEAQAVIPHHNMMGEVIAATMNNPMTNFNMSGMPMYMPLVPADQNIPFVGYGGPQAGHRASVPVHDERGYAGLRGEGGAPGARIRDRELERDSFHSRDINRRPSPERPAEAFNRPSRWNENPAPIVMPMRRDESPPYQPWAARESHSPLPPLRQPNLPGPHDQNQYQPRQSKPEYQRTDPQWELRSTRWDPEPNPQRRPEPEQEWGPRPNENWQPEPNRAWDEPSQNWEPANRQWEGDSPRYNPQDGTRQFREEYPSDQYRNEPDVHWNRSGHSGDPNRDEGNDRWDRNLAPNSLGNNNWERREESEPPVSSSRNERHGPKPSSSNYNKEWRDGKRPNFSKRNLPEREQGPKNWKQVAQDYPPSKKQKPNIPRREGLAMPWQRENNGKQPRPIKDANPRQLPFKKVPQQTHLQHAPIEKPKPQKPITMKYLINKDQTMRGQATAILCKESMLGSNLADPSLSSFVKRQLKLCIKGRIDVMLGEQLKDNCEEIIEAYRVKYPKRDDKSLYQAIRDKCMIQKKIEDKKKAEEYADAAGGKAEPKEAKEKFQRFLTNLEKTDKQVLRETQQQRKLEFSKDDYFKLDPITDKALDEELDKLDEIFASECSNPEDNHDSTICSRITERSTEELRKSIRLHVTKRILNISTGLTVRIFGPKLPKKTDLKQYLLPYRVDRLSKNQKGSMYVANIGRFEDYDALCRQEKHIIDGMPVTIKSMHLVGPPPKVTRNQIRQRRKRFIQSQMAPANAQGFAQDERLVAADGFADFAEDVDIDNIKDEDLEDF